MCSVGQVSVFSLLFALEEAFVVFQWLCSFRNDGPLFCLCFPLVEVVEHACGMATLQMGEYVSNVSNGIDTYSIREPLGVCAGICPFNFPAMIPLWVSLYMFYSLLFACQTNPFHFPLSIIVLLQGVECIAYLNAEACHDSYHS